MRSASSDLPAYLPDRRMTMVKVLVAGAFGVGKTTLIGSVSEIRPLSTDEIMTSASAAVDDLSGLANKTTTTVGLDFGRRTLQPDLVLYLFGTPGQERFRALWQDLAHQTVGAVVLVDSRRIQDSFWAMTALEEHGIPFAVAVNRFPDAPIYPADELRQALALTPATPLVDCDARDGHSSAGVLVALMEHLLNHHPTYA